LDSICALLGTLLWLIGIQWHIVQELSAFWYLIIKGFARLPLFVAYNRSELNNGMG